MGNSSLRVYLFGHFRMESQTGPIQLPTRKVEALLAYLILNPNPHSRERLAALLWGDTTDARARASLRNALSIPRRKISPDLLLADRATVQLNPSFPLWVDALNFKSQVTSFLEAPSSERNSVNLELYSDDLLVDFYEDWVLVERQDMQALYLKTMLEFTRQSRAASEYERAIQYAQQALVLDAANERAHQHLMFCYLALGKRSAALRQYEAIRLFVERTESVQRDFALSDQNAGFVEKICRQLDGSPAVIVINAPWQITGGTRHFANADGEGSTRGVFNLVSHEGDFEMEGWMSYSASDGK